jgi:hypothetical protein
MSRAILDVKAPRVKQDFDFSFEGDIYAPHKLLMIAKTLMMPSERAMHCLVLNPTDRAVRLRAGTPLGSLHPRQRNLKQK